MRSPGSWWRRWAENAAKTDPAAAADAFVAATAPHHAALFELALALRHGDADQAEDLVQEALVRAYRAFDRFQPGAPAYPWLATILRRVFLNQLDLASARREVAVDVLPEPATALADPLEALLAVERQEALRRALAALPPDQATVIVLVDVQGRSYEEAADVLEVPVGTVRSRLARGRARMAGLLTGSDGGD